MAHHDTEVKEMYNLRENSVKEQLDLAKMARRYSKL